MTFSTPPPPPPQTTIFFQDKCLNHRFIRSSDVSNVVERPQRVRAVKTGVAAAIARLEQLKESSGVQLGSSEPEDALMNALKRLNIEDEPVSVSGQNAVRVVMSTANVNLLSNEAVKYIHGDVDGDVYLEKLIALARESGDKVARGECEIPEGLPRGDLYLCPESIDAIQGAVGTVCEAVDTVLKPGCGTRAFVAIRPPGHHCGEDTPSGFCFVNNVAIGAAHAHLEHNILRAVILDIDLHHGNGTQAIAWQINEETYRKTLEAAASGIPCKPSLQVYYGSIHDPLSYPCEDGNAAMLQAASVSLHGSHGQHIENVHLSEYTCEGDFWNRLYMGPYNRLLERAEEFLKKGDGEAIVFISAGFDASEHEGEHMSRHGRKLPTAYYKRFAHAVRVLADKYAKGRIVSVLEGGYSNRALCSGTMAHVLGLAEENSEVDESWWSVENLIKIEKATQKRRGARGSNSVPEKWLERTVAILSTIDTHPSPPTSPKLIPPSTMVLRDRSKKMSPSGSETERSSPSTPRKSHSKVDAPKSAVPMKKELVESAIGEPDAPTNEANKKLPRVILRVNPPPEIPSSGT